MLAVPLRSSSRLFLLAATLLFTAGLAGAQSYLVGYWENGANLTSAQVGHLTHLVYAFATVDSAASTTGEPTCDLTNPPTQATLQQLKSWNSNLKILISIGGEGSGPAFLNSAANAQNFAADCVAVITHHFGSTIDGIDIDWEFPDSSSDAQAFSNVMNYFSEDMGKAPWSSPNKILTATVGNYNPNTSPAYSQYAGVDFTGNLGTGVIINNLVTYYGVMAYDFASDDATTFNAPLFVSDMVGQQDTNAGTGQTTVINLIKSLNVPANKVVLGVPFYGVQYTDVTANSNDGFYEIGPPPDGPTDVLYSAIAPTLAGTTRYCDVGQSGAAGCPATWGSPFTIAPTSGAQQAWIYNSSQKTFTTFDDPGAIAAKTKYARTMGLGGMLLWEIDQDYQSQLLSAISNNMQSRTLAVAENGDVWGISPSRTAYQYSGSGSSWVPVGTLSQIVAGADGTAWGVAAGNTAYTCPPSGSCAPLGTTLAQVAVGNTANDSVWGIGPLGVTYKWNGKSFAAVTGVTLAQIAVGSDGDAWGLTKYGQVYQYVSGTGWKLEPGVMQQIEVGNSTSVFAVTPGGVGEKLVDGAWQAITGAGNLAQISVGGDGDAWAINASGSIFHLVSGSWESVPGTLHQIVVGSAENVWGTNYLGNVYKYNGSGWTQVSSPI